MPRRNKELLEDGTAVPALTEKEKIFCAEYLSDYNAAAAAIRAGYAPENAKQLGYEVLHRPQVRNSIKKKQHTRLLELDVKGEGALLEIAEMAFQSTEGLIGLLEQETGLELKGKIPASGSTQNGRSLVFRGLDDPEK